MDERYIEFTAVIGPIDEPHQLHTFDEEGNPQVTVHGELADRLFVAVHDVDGDADMSARVTTEAEMQAQSDAITERDRLRDELDALRTQYKSHTETLTAGVRGLERMVARVEDERNFLSADLHRERMAKEINDQALLTAINERDRLREAVDADRSYQIANLTKLTMERDRLQAVVDAVREIYAAGAETRELVAEVAEESAEEYVRRRRTPSFRRNAERRRQAEIDLRQLVLSLDESEATHG